MHILRAADRIAVPWKNGGGVTSEVAAFPPGAGFDDFGWRISIAEIHEGGPFSLFPDIDRTLAMLKGRVSLSIAGRAAIALSPDHPPVEFPGDVVTSAELLGAFATDLNVMTRRGAFTSRVTRATAAQASDAAIAFAVMLSPTTMKADGAAVPLAWGDAVRFEPGETPAFAGSPDFYWIELFPAEKAAKTR